jgi:hypothetical protein
LQVKNRKKNGRIRTKLELGKTGNREQGTGRANPPSTHQPVKEMLALATISYYLDLKISAFFFSPRPFNRILRQSLCPTSKAQNAAEIQRNSHSG